MHFNRSLATVITLACAFAATASAASPFAGKWKYNASRSVLTGATDSIAADGANAWKFTYGSYSWTVKADGSDQPTPFGNTDALKVVSPTKWELVNKVNGKVSSNDTWTLSADGQSMTRTSDGKREDGKSFHDVTNMKRTAGTKGFEGTWESANVKVAPAELDIDNASAAGFTYTMPAYSIKLVLTFDGKDCPFESPRIPAGTTASATLSNPNTLKATTKFQGKVLDSETWEISADGKTLTYTELDAGEAKPSVWVFDKM